MKSDLDEVLDESEKLYQSRNSSEDEENNTKSKNGINRNKVFNHHKLSKYVKDSTQDNMLKEQFKEQEYQKQSGIDIDTKVNFIAVTSSTSPPLDIEGLVNVDLSDTDEDPVHHIVENHEPAIETKSLFHMFTDLAMNTCCGSPHFPVSSFYSNKSAKSNFRK